MNPEITSSKSLAFPQTTQEEHALCEFEEAVSDIVQNPEPHYLLRWLRARELNVENARVMLEKNLEWRDAHASLEDIGTWEPDPEVEKDVKYKFIGFDNDGRPVVWAPLGRADIRKLVEKGLKEDVAKLLRKIMEECVARVEVERQKNGLVTQVVGIFDMEELWFSKIASMEVIQTAVGFFREFESFYPEIVHSVYVINAHWVFNYGFNFVKPIMSARTIGKVKLYGKDRKKWEQALLQNIPAESIPEEYGGTGEAVL